MSLPKKSFNCLVSPKVFATVLLLVAVNIMASAQVNLALRKPAVSSPSPIQPASYAVDGNAGSRWESAYSDPQWIHVDLGANYNINTVRILWQNAHAVDYRIEVSNDALNWTILRTVTGNTTYQTAYREHADLNGSGRYVRIFGTKRGIEAGTTLYGYSIWELEVYGTTAGTSFTITDENNAPNTVAENSATGTTVGITAKATSPEGKAVTYSLTDNAGGRFAINATTGIVTVANSALLDFETNTTHNITVQASDGTRTTSQMFTIAVTDVNENINLALNKPVVALSAYNSTNSATNAVDGNANSRWESQHNIDPQWIYVDLGATYTINTVKILWESAHAKDYRIEVSDNTTSWTTITTITDNSSFKPTYNEHVNLNSRGRYVRIVGTRRGIGGGKNLYGYSIFELEVYGSPIKPTYTWNGSAGSNWNSASNWTPNGVPAASDPVVIVAAGTPPQLQGPATITNLTMRSGTLNLNGHQLSVTGNVLFEAGTVMNGNLNVQCSEVRFRGTTFEASTTLSTVCNNIYLEGSVFNGATSITKQGEQPADNDGNGGSVFNGPVVIRNNSSGRLRMGHLTGDDFNNNVTFVRSGTGSLEVSHNTRSTFSGHITVGSSMPVSLGTGSGTVVADGSNDQIISQSGAAGINFNRMELAKPGGNLVLNTPLHIASSLNLKQGKIISSDDNQLLFMAGATVIGASNSSFVEGPVVRYGTGAFTFPVGKGNYYRSIGIAPAGVATDAFKAEYFPENPNSNYPLNTKDVAIDHLSSCEYWLLDRIGGSASTDVTLSWDNTAVEGCAVQTPADLLVAHWDVSAPGGPKWANHGHSRFTGDASAGTITSSTHFTSFSPVTLGSFSINNALPVELLGFNAELDKNEVLLYWSTASEKDNKGFEVQRSADGITFQSLSFINGIGNSSIQRNYSYKDKLPLSGTSYYRLKQIDFDEKAAYSKTLALSFITNQPYVLVAPNPSSDKTDIYLQFSEPKTCYIQIIDIAGHVVFTKTVSSILSDKITLDLSKIAKGLYFVTVRSEDKILYNRKLLKE